MMFKQQNDSKSELYLHRVKKLWLLLSLIPLWGTGQLQLSPQAQIRVVTCGPYQGELYSAFGHSAIRVMDPQYGLDLIYNYGVFDYDQPNFYLNFAKGYLHYQLDVGDYSRFRYFYIQEDRFMHEQILSLTLEEKQRLFDFLQWNAREENKYYFYDYFYDNCATRIRDALVEVFGDRIRFDGSYIETDYSIRDLCDLYLQHQPWGDLGIDLCLGLPMDKRATPYEYMFLPDYLESGLAHAYIQRDGREEPLVKQMLITHQTKEQPKNSTLFSPLFYSSLLLLLGLWITYRAHKRNTRPRVFDAILFTLVGLLGWILFVLWVATDHQAAAQNFNLLWVFPLYFPIALLLLQKSTPGFLGAFFMFTTFLHGLTILAWPWWPQDLHEAWLPLVVLLMIRSYFTLRRLRSA